MPTKSSTPSVLLSIMSPQGNEGLRVASSYWYPIEPSPKARHGIEAKLARNFRHRRHVRSSFKSMGLAFFQYWIKPYGSKIRWSDINYFGTISPRRRWRNGWPT